MTMIYGKAQEGISLPGSQLNVLAWKIPPLISYLLDYEYIPNDTLHHVMDWVTRIKYPRDSLRGLAYLQDDCHPQTTHWDIQSSIIFQANNFEGWVSDFGLAKLVLEADAHVSSREMGLDIFLVVRELAEQETNNGIFKMLRSDVTQFLTSILIGTTVANIGATALVIEAATEIFGEARVSAATGVITVAILLLPEINPMVIAVPNATEVARFVVRPVLNFFDPPFPTPTFIMRHSATDVHNEIVKVRASHFVSACWSSGSNVDCVSRTVKASSNVTLQPPREPYPFIRRLSGSVLCSRQIYSRIQL
ncbi:hypothetical protein Nepgr_004509 [Nepenthes gracilis]|uniref:CNNM transmembrane domain-containing protein n=1 Tax=Nepenthes gracilis TaxID=150966 RepID=A0AAD3XFC6_NEPGR|nr:hypothetical protein Nepgr_004509 [Nepenthes gracilis]